MTPSDWRWRGCSRSDRPHREAILTLLNTQVGTPVTAGHSLVVFGGGGHARAVIDVLARLGALVAAVVDPHAAFDGSVFHSDDDGVRAALGTGRGAVIAVGDNGRRLRLAGLLATAGVAAPPVVAATATVAADARLGAGTVVLEHAHIGPGAVLGAACIVNTGAVVEHDCVLAEGVHCAPGSVLTGAVTCGTGVLVGAGATVLPGVGVGDGAVVGAGAAVTSAVAEHTTVVGVPARELPQ